MGLGRSKTIRKAGVNVKAEIAKISEKEKYNKLAQDLAKEDSLDIPENELGILIDNDFITLIFHAATQHNAVKQLFALTKYACIIEGRTDLEAKKSSLKAAIIDTKNVFTNEEGQNILDTLSLVYDGCGIDVPEEILNKIPGLQQDEELDLVGTDSKIDMEAIASQ